MFCFYVIFVWGKAKISLRNKIEHVKGHPARSQMFTSKALYNIMKESRYKGLKTAESEFPNEIFDCLPAPICTSLARQSPRSRLNMAHRGKPSSCIASEGKAFKKSFAYKKQYRAYVCEPRAHVLHSSLCLYLSKTLNRVCNKQSAHI